MLEKLTVLAKASAMARHAAARHRLLAENVANADTPGFRARDLRPFAEIVNRETVNAPLTLRASRPEHVAGSDRVSGFEMVEVEAPAAPNGNTVQLEEQSVRATETQGQHALAMAIYGKAADLWRIGLGRSR